jgi:uncharacterized protein
MVPTGKIIVVWAVIFGGVLVGGCAPAAFNAQEAGAERGAVVQYGERFRIRSGNLKEEREYWVYLPSSYAADGRYAPKRYPVLYVLDGEWNFDWACKVVQYMGDVLEIPEMIVVGIPNTERERDMTPTHNDSEASSGGGRAFERFLSEELAPAIEGRYRTEPYRILVGHSIAGALAVDCFLQQKKVFQGFVAIDPSLWWDNQTLVEQAKSFVPGANSHDALFLAEANWPRNLYEESKSNKYGSDLFLAAMKGKEAPGIRIGSQFLDTDDHGSSRLMAVYQGLRFIFDDYKPANLYGLDTRELLETHFLDVSGRLGYRVLPPELYVNKIANALLTPKLVDQAIGCFEMNVENYPGSAGAYCHLGDAYRVKGERGLAQRITEGRWSLIRSWIVRWRGWGR